VAAAKWRKNGVALAKWHGNNRRNGRNQQRLSVTGIGDEAGGGGGVMAAKKLAASKCQPAETGGVDGSESIWRVAIMSAGSMSEGG
jgi:hypothetical protein